MHASKISHTAWLVMMSQIGLAQSPRWAALADAKDTAFYRACYEHCRLHSLIYRVIDRLLPVALHMRLIEKILMFGAPLHFLLRKRAIEQQAHPQLRAGSQLVVIGAGFDHLCVKIARENSHIGCFEIDMPTMQQHKRACIEACYGALPANFHSLGADLSRTTLADLLLAHPAYDKNKPTLFVAEGVMMYLREEEARAAFEAFRTLASAPACVLFTAYGTNREPASGFWNWLQKTILSVRGERFKWNITADRMAQYLKSCGYETRWLQSYADLQRPHRTAAEMAVIENVQGEYLVYAEGL